MQEKLKPLYEKYKDIFHCVYQIDIYTNEQWLEIMPLTASKSNAIAVQNAHEDLKKYATAIITSNDDDGVAKWLESKFS